MIYNDDFVWLHFPKCAGTKIEHLFDEHFSDHPEVVQDYFSADKDPTISWHDSVAEREQRDSSFKLGSRTIICSIRRLPGWLVSRYNFECFRNPDLPHNPESLLTGKFLEANGYLNHADNYIRKYLPEEIIQKKRIEFLRTESFEVDFKRIFGEFLDISAIPDEKFKRKVNLSKNYISTDCVNNLYQDLNKVYDACPLWKQVELLAYGDLGSASL